MAAADATSPAPADQGGGSLAPSADTPPATTETSSGGPPPEPPRPIDGKRLLDAPSRYDHLMLRASYPYEAQYQNLLYEAGNPLLRRGATDAQTVAERWQRLSRGVGGVFVLRDSLFSQQDHPTQLSPYALMMPPSWVTVAVAEVDAGRAIRPPRAPAFADDAAWQAIPTATQLFGVFPPSDALFTYATRKLSGSSPADATRIKAARASVRSLATDVQAMIAASPKGIEAVAAAGAERIASSDVRYFGRALRYHRVIPIYVENPSHRELAKEGKGMTVYGREFPDRLVKLARDVVYQRRLRDGALAVERYDLSQPAERKRAIAFLEAVIPAKHAPPGGTLWLWVTGRLDASGETGEDAMRYIESFQRELKAARIDHERLRLLSKPSVELPAGPERAKTFRNDTKWFRRLGLPYSVKITTGELGRLLAQAL